MLEEVSRNTVAKDNGVKVFFCVKNELDRLPFFFSYYRNMGVVEFFAVNNNSTDGSCDYLLKQEDTHTFFTNESYSESNAGRKWTSELTRKYGIGSWCLTLDVDEFLLFPESENIGLNGLTTYLDAIGARSLYCLFLDFYSDKKLNETHYYSDQNIFDICKFHDRSDSYYVSVREEFPYFHISGGVRQRVFWSSSDLTSGPSMRKLPLVKWNSDTYYIHSTHSCSPVVLADITGVLAHFKFLQGFDDYARKEVKDNNRMRNSSDYRKYSKRFDLGVETLMEDRLSEKYANTKDLISGRLMISSPQFCKHFHLKPVDSLSYVSSSTVDLTGGVVPFSSLLSAWPVISQMINRSANQSSGNASYESTVLMEEIDKLLESRYWRITAKLRRFLVRTNLLGPHALPEENKSIMDTRTLIQHTFQSFWWDLFSIFRLVAKAVRKILFFLRR